MNASQELALKRNAVAEAVRNGKTAMAGANTHVKRQSSNNHWVNLRNG